MVRPVQQARFEGGACRGCNRTEHAADSVQLEEHQLLLGIVNDRHTGDFNALAWFNPSHIWFDPYLMDKMW